MIKQHNLKILPEHFNPVYEGLKTAELRKSEAI
nr:MAG TPA: activating signal cointegrator [Caudoviricetes sp.]